MRSALCAMRSLVNEMKHHSKGCLTFPALHLRLPTHQLDQSGGDVEPSSPSLTVEVSLFILFRDLTGIGDLRHGPPFPSIGPNGKLPSLLGYGISGVVKEII